MPESRLPYYVAPEGLRDRVRSSLRAASGSASRSVPVVVQPSVSRWAPAAWLVGIAAVLVMLISAVAHRRSDSIESRNAVAAVIDGHLRALAPGHLTDVASTDQHTVKPWFAGRLPFSPPVHDLASAGFPLVGGRVDVLDGQAVAALVYSRRGHIINLFVRPMRNDERAQAVSQTSRGINVVSWTSDRNRIWVASDLDMIELAEFRVLLSPADQDGNASRQ